jgi:two-component system sensor histidine kinase TctE
VAWAICWKTSPEPVDRRLTTMAKAAGSTAAEPLRRRLLRQVMFWPTTGLSLRRQLLLWLLLPQLVLWGAAATVTYQLALRHSERANDRALFVASRALARQVKPVGSGLLVDFPRAAKDILEADPDDIVYYTVSSPPGQFILGNYKLPLPPEGISEGGGRIPAHGIDQPQFYDAVLTSSAGPTAMRVGAVTLDWGDPGARQTMLVQVAKSRVSREALAQGILFDTVLPLSLLVLAMSALVWAGIRTGLTPLDRLRDAVGGRAAGDLTPIELLSAPLEVRDLAAALNSLLAAVQASVAQQHRFVNDAAHQLRTPLAGLKGQTEVALAEAHDPQLRARLARVHESAVRSAHLVNQLLSLARAEPESPLIQASAALDLVELARSVTAEWVPRALQAGVDLGMDDADEGQPAVMVRGHGLLIGEALANLIDNAIRYGGGPGGEVTVATRRQGPVAVLEVRDNGPGVAPEMHAAVFQRFVRATHEGTGCGLGLAIVKGIAERHGGSVALDNLDPRGLCVQIKLPLAESGSG